MKLLEDQAKDLFRRYGIPVPAGATTHSPADVKELTYPAMVKALVPIGGRGKAGGIVKVSTAEEARAAVSRLLTMDISGFKVRSLLIEEALDVRSEAYLSIAVDRSSGLPLLLATPSGGMEVETAPEESIGRWTVHPFLGIEPHLVRDVAMALGLGAYADQLGELLKNIWRAFRGLDCELVEINPLVLTSNGRLVAADAKVTINDDALFRHPELAGMGVEEDELEAEARRGGISLVRLDGDVGVIANGAGLTMATLDELVLNGGRGGAFLDLGGTDDPAKVEAAFALMVKTTPRVILVNIFGGITKCDTVAAGIIRAVDELKLPTPIVARIRGVNEEEARIMLKAKGISALTDLAEAVKVAIEEGA